MLLCKDLLVVGIELIYYNVRNFLIYHWFLKTI